MTKHKITRPFNIKTADIFKRDGDRVRYIDPVTARVSGWVVLSTPTVKAKPVPAKPEARKVDYSKMVKAELQALADTRGIKYTTKTTNKALADALSA